MKLKAYIDYLNGYSILMRKQESTTKGEASVLVDVIEELKELLTKEERKRYNYLLLTIQNNLNKIKGRNDNILKNLEKELLKLKAEC